MSCSYYEFKSSLFGGDYYCNKKQDYVNSDDYSRYCRGYSYDECPIYKGDSSSGGCYLTSACVYAKGLPDDCYELETLRNFRDGWLKKLEEGEKDIKKYYEIAPVIVSVINEKPERKKIYEMIYDCMVMPCVKLIEDGKNYEALKLYQKMTEQLKEAYC